MTIKRILHCTLIFMVLMSSGCGLVFGPDSNVSQNTDFVNPHPIEWTTLAEQVKDLSDKITSEGNAQLTVGKLKDDVQNMSMSLGKDQTELRAKCAACSDKVLSKAQEARASLQKVVEKLGREKADAPVNDQLKSEIVPLLTDARAKFDDAHRLSTPTNSSTLWDDLILGVKIFGAVLALALLATALTYLWRRSWKTVEINMSKVLAAHLAATREGQPDYAPKLSSLSSAQAEMSSKLTELNTEVRSLARFVRESLVTRRSDGNSAYSGLNYQSHVEDVSPKDEPEFPVSAVDYLGKMNRFANVVRPDFQNGILVNAPDGDGELVLIRDSRDETQPLFVVPRATQFQTTQDFYTYYQKYYDCVRPSAGDVWIIGPAVVEKVAGGWQLREKGMLEVR